MAPSTSGYDAFISYSHALDGTLAPALQQGLERFAKPWYQPRALRIFRDTASLSANPRLWSAIEQALASSRWLVLMASPEAAQSVWVERELSWWLRNRSADRVLIVLTEGDLVWDEVLGKLNRQQTNVLPPSLRDALVEEPRWIDLRWLHDAEQVAQANPRLRESVADIAAAVREVPKDSLVGEHIRQHRLAMRLARGAVTGLILLLVASLIGARVAVTQRNEARTQRNEAQNQARLATSRQLAAQAQTQQSLRPAVSLMLSLEALRVADTPEAHASLLDTLLKSPFAKILASRPKPIKEVEFSADGRLVAVAGDDDTVHVWQVGGVTERHDVATLSGMAVSFGDGRLMATSGGRSPVLWDMSTPARPVRLGQLSSGPAGAVQLGRGRRALVDGAPASLWDVSQPRRPRLLGKVPSGSRDTALSPDGRLLATANRPGRSELWDVGDATRPRLVGSIPVASDIVVFSPDSSMLAVTPRDDVAHLWDVRNPSKPGLVTELRTASNTPAFDVDFAPDGKRAVTANFDGTASVWDISRPSAPVETTVLRGHTGDAYTADFSPDGRRIVTGSQDGTAIIWNVAPAAIVPPLAQIGGFEDVPEVIVFSPDSRRLLVVNGYLDPTAVWNVSRPDKPVRESILTLSGALDATTNTRGDRLLTAGGGTSWLWDASDFGRPRKLRSFPGDDVGLSADGKTVATVANGVVRLWRESGKDWQSVGSVPGDGVTFSPDPDLFAVMREGSTMLVRVSDPQHPVSAGILTGSNPAFGGKRSLLALIEGEDGETSIALWDVRNPPSPRKVATLPHEGREVTFNPDGTVMAIGSADGVPELFDVSDPSQPRSIGRLVGHRGSAYRVVFSPDGRVLATGSYDKSIRLWDLSAAVDMLTDPVARACAIAGPGLSQADWNLYFPGQTYRRSCPG